MSTTKNNAIRCDWCGKLSRSRDGAYTKPDGISAGYIHQPEWERFPDGRMDVGGTHGSNDICEECAGSCCPACGSAQIVHTTPTAPGPLGWGGRCKSCGYSWGMPDKDNDS